MHMLPISVIEPRTVLNNQLKLSSYIKVQNRSLLCPE